MLYVSTRNRTDSYTAYRALHENYAPDGGLYVPFQLPQFTEEEIQLLKNRSFGDNVALLLNMFFSARLTGWDIEFCCGRNPLETVSLSHRLLVTEAWHNTASAYSYAEQAIFDRLCGDCPPKPVSNWAKIAIYIAVLFAAYGNCDGIEPGQSVDIAVSTDGFVAPVAAWYARKMGLPIGMIICGSVDSSAPWDLIHKGDLGPSVLSAEIKGMERLVYFALGQSEAARFAAACEARRTYHISEDTLSLLNAGVFTAVISNSRIANVISNFYRTHNYILDTVAAVSYAALQDYRAKTGDSKLCMITVASSPVQNAEILKSILDLTEADLEKIVNR